MVSLNAATVCFVAIFELASGKYLFFWECVAPSRSVSVLAVLERAELGPLKEPLSARGFSHHHKALIDFNVSYRGRSSMIPPVRTFIAPRSIP